MGPVKASISLLMLHIQVKMVTCSKTTVVTVREGHSVDFTCEYPPVHQNNSKFFCRAGLMCSSYLIRTNPHERWATKDRFSLYDNLTAGQFVVHVERLKAEDSGNYWCVVKVTDYPDCISEIQLYVTRPDSSSMPNIIIDKHTLPLFVTVVSCLSALLFVFLFTLCLIFTVRNRKHTHQRASAQEMSSDYEDMKSGVLPEQKLCTVELEDHTDVDVPARVRQYQGMDVSTSAENIYHGLSSKPTRPGDRPTVTLTHSRS